MAVANLVLKVTGQMASLEKDLQKNTALLGDFGKQFQTISTKAAKAQEDLNRAFSGEKIITQAAGIVTAVEKIGGASKLTSVEMDRVNRVVSEAIGKYAALGQTAPQAMLALASATKKVNDESGVFSDLTNRIKATTLGFISAQAVIGGVQTAFHTLTAFVGSSIDAYGKAEAASKKMTTALQAQGTATPAVIKHFDNLATQFQRTTVFSDDLITEMEALLTQIGNVAPAQMGKALTAATDLASGLGIDLETATKLVGKAFEGETGTLKRYGIVIDDVKLKADGVTAVLDAVQSKFGGQAQAEIETYAGQIKQLTNDWDNFKEAVGKSIVQDPLIRAALAAASKGVQNIADQASTGTPSITSWWIALTGNETSGTVLRILGQVSQNMADVNAQAEQFRAKLSAPVAGLGSLDPEFAEIQRRGKRFFEETVDGWTKSDEAAKKYRESVQQLADQLTHTDLAREAKKLSDALASIAAQKRTPQLLQDVADRAADLFLKGGRLSPQLLQLAITFSALNLKVIEGTAGLNDLGLKAELVVPKLSALAEAAKDFADKMKLGADGLSGFVKISDGFDDGAKKVLKAVQAALNFTDAIIDAGRAFHDLGQQFNGIFGGIVSGIGDIVTAWGAATKAQQLFEQGGGTGRRPMSKAEAAAALAAGAVQIAGATSSGGTGKRTLSGAAAGASAGVPFAAFTGGASIAIGAGIGALVGFIRGHKAAVQAAKDIAEQFEILKRTLVSTHGGMEQLIVDADLVGINIKEAFNWKDAQAFQRVVDDLNDRTQKLTDAMEEYGFTWEDTGIQARQAKLNDIADTLLEKTQLLKGAGIDYHEILVRQSHDYSDLVQAAIRTGTEIPSALKPVLQDLIDMGTLVDENGQSFTDLGQLSFAKTLTQGFDEVTDAIKELTRALTGDLGGALDELGKRRVTIPIDFDVSDSTPRLAGGGIVRHPTLAMVGEHGPEAVIPLGSSQLGFGEISITVISKLDDRVVARSSVKQMPNVLNGMGLR